eukprot:6113498-Prymnesium_polylepis.1
MCGGASRSVCGARARSKRTDKPDATQPSSNPHHPPRSPALAPCPGALPWRPDLHVEEHCGDEREG